MAPVLSLGYIYTYILLARFPEYWLLSPFFKAPAHLLILCAYSNLPPSEVFKAEQEKKIKKNGSAPSPPPIIT